MAQIKIYPKFIGRLGNNLFQVAACIGYAKQHGVKWGVKKGYVEQSFNANQIDRFFPNLPATTENHRRYSESKHGDESFNYHEIPFNEDGVEIVGFFQSEKYFENAKDEVRAAFDLPYYDHHRLEGYCSLHVRRGDYVQHAGSFPPVDENYVAAAMRFMMGKGVSKFIVCSDDIAWCKENIKLPAPHAEIVFNEGTDEWTDFVTMASCDHHIIANSSFSWWAAWLGRNPEKQVVSPSYRNWFGPDNGIKVPPLDLIPPTWSQIRFR